MNTFVLKREYVVQLPNSYVEVDRDISHLDFQQDSSSP